MHSVRGTFADIAGVAPELASLFWWENRYDKATISYNGTEPSMFFTPQIRVFTDSTESTCYLYYLNRYCRANDNPFQVRVSAFNFPSSTPFGEYALDHNRRFLVQGDSTGIDMFTFLDTLDAGEARLLQMIKTDSLLAADVRITDPDVFVVLPLDSDTLTDYTGASGTPVSVHARFYNMGMRSLNNVLVYLKDETTGDTLGTTRISFDGLSIRNCYETDMAEAVFNWTPDSDDVGVHRLRVFTHYLQFDPDTSDNDAEIVYVVSPADFAATELSNPWDMTEAKPPAIPPAWYTNDVESVSGWESGMWTDSISGMFEGVVDADYSTSNAMTMELGTETISGSTYDQISLIGKSGLPCDVYLTWSTNVPSVGEIKIGTLNSSWGELAPYDLSGISNWNGKTITSVSLSFRRSSALGDYPIRIGWVKLTE